MKIVSLNIWGGRMFDNLREFILSHADADVFCFQEVFDTPTTETIVDEHYRANIFSEIAALLPNHEAIYAPVHEGFGVNLQLLSFTLYRGLAIFVKKSMPLKDQGSIFVFGEYNSRKEDDSTMPRNLQYISLSHRDRDLTIAHMHGLRTGSGKGDTPDRLMQAKKVKEFMDARPSDMVFCGDLNLLPDTESLAIMASGKRNLITEYAVTSTRSKLYRSYGKKSSFADYTLISPTVEVKNFSVPYSEASDHLPMILEIS